MGTNGFVFIRCRGRYFVYYNHWDSYPEGLGEAIASKIPTDPDKYCKWLESMRQIYSRLCQQFEEQLLPVEVTKCQNEDAMSSAEQHAKCFLALDDRLVCPPIQTLLKRNNLFIEWTYTIDLDRELLGVDDSVFFALAKIPRGRLWARFLGVEGRRRTLRENTPKEIILSMTCPPVFDNQAKNRYRELSIKIVFPKAAMETGGILRSPHHYLLVDTFRAFHYNYRWLLDGHILRWAPDCFSFREIAFALLSLAAGETLPNNQQTLLSKLLSGNHLPGKEPGSAPTSTSFWLGNVLVYLASRLDLVDIKEASVSKAVDVGLGQGLKRFFAVVFSIIDFVLIQVQVNKDGRVHVQRSTLMNLFYFSGEDSLFAESPRSRKPPFTGGNTVTPGSGDRSENVSKAESESMQRRKRKKTLPEDDRRAFVALMHFFDAAANQHLLGARSKALPNEILTVIMQFSDIQTCLALAKVSPYCREMRCRKFLLNNDYAMIGVDAHGEQGSWTIEDRQTGERISTQVSIKHTKFGRSRDDKDDTRLNPVINVADKSRQSIVDSVTLHLPGVHSNNPVYTKEVSRPTDQESFYRAFGYCPEDETDLIFSIPDYAYPSFVEKAWGRYIESIVDKDRQGANFCFAHMDPGLYPCLHPIRYRLLRIRGTGQLEAFMCSHRDESPEEWSKLERFAIYKLSEEENDKRLGWDMRGRPVIVAFGTKVKLFYYTSYTENPPSVSPVSNNAYKSRIAASANDPNPANRLIPLISEGEPFDICDMDARARLEHWIRVFNDGLPKLEEYDPITETYLPRIKRPKKKKESDESDKSDSGHSAAGIFRRDSDSSYSSQDAVNSEDEQSNGSQDDEDLENEQFSDGHHGEDSNENHEHSE